MNAVRFLGRRLEPGSFHHVIRGGLIAGAALIAFHAWSLLDRDWGRNYDAAVRWYGVVTLLLLATVLPAPPYSRPKLPAIGDWFARHRWELLALAAVLAIGVLMRVYDFGHFPPKAGTSFEEAQTGGNAYHVIHSGKRPVNFALTDYSGALGFTLFGYGTDGLRLPFLLMGILSLVPFYLLARLLLSTPAALFTTALLAVSRWGALSARIADELFSGMNLSIVAALLLVAALRTRNGLVLIALGLAIGLLNYEYTGYRYIPFLLAATFVIALAVPFGKDALARRRVDWAGLGRRWWLAPVFALALFIAVTPVIVDGLHGSNAYYEALERHRSETQETAFFGVPTTWERNLKWSFELFLPFGPGERLAEPPLTEVGTRMLDPVTAGLAVAAMAYVVLSFYKPYRLLFAGWFFIGLVVGGVLPNNFYVPRFTAILPAMFIIIGFLVDDAVRLVPWRRLRLTGYVVLAGLAAWAFVVNVTALHSQAHDDTVRRLYANPFVSLCSFAHDLGRDHYVYAWADGQQSILAFVPSDYTWACQEVAGEPLTWPVALSPLEPPDESNVAFVYLTQPSNPIDPAALLRQAYPLVAWRADKEDQPFGTYVLRAYTAPTSALGEQRGLSGAYLGAGGSTQRVDGPGLFVTGGEIDWPEGAAEVRWDGLVLLRQQGEVALAARQDVSMKVLIDGAVTFSDGVATPRNLEAGWHGVQISLRRDGGGPFPGLAWLGSAGTVQALPLEGDFFARSPVAGWQHVISIRMAGHGETVRWQQIDPYPAIGSGLVRLPDWLSQSLGVPDGTAGELLGEEWRSRWQVPSAAHYDLPLTAQFGPATLLVDGLFAGVARVDPGTVSRTEIIRIDLAAGTHVIEIRYRRNEGDLAGVALTPPAGIAIEP